MFRHALADILRSINLFLSAVVFLWMTIRRFKFPKQYPRGGLRRDVWAMAYLWNLTLLVGTLELLLNTGTYVRVGIAMAAVLTTLSLLIRPREDWPKPDWKEKEESR